VVRDLLMGRRHVALDFDYIASGIEAKKLISILEGMGRADHVGRSFGVIKFRTPGGITVDVALPRFEVSTGTGHKEFDVRPDPSLPVEKDLERRDYTINSMAVNLRDMSLADPLGGRKDLDERLLRVNRENSFVEDPLRILRGVQFMARFGLDVEPETTDLMVKHRELIPTVSIERVRDELNKMMLLSESPSLGYIFMHETGILPLVLPELDETWGVDQNEFHPDDVFHHSVRSCDLAEKELLIRWCALLHDLGKKKMKKRVEGRTVFYRHESESADIAREVLTRLVFPSSFVESASHLISHHMFMITEDWSDSAVRRFISRVGPENIDDLIAIREADGTSRGDGRTGADVAYSRARIEKVLSEESALKRSDLAVTGRDVIAIAGVEPGPEVGRILGELLEEVLDHPEYNTRERLERMIRERERK
jgi:tRNA nucleotidyltransferase (CCA-adding enzyme)